MSDEKKLSPDEERLDFNQQLRHDLVVNLTTTSSGDKYLPTDAETVNTIKGLLKDSDSSVFTKRRVMVEEAGAETDRMAAELLDKVMENIPRAKRDGATGTVKRTNHDKFDESQLPSFDIEEGSLTPVGDDVDLDAINKMGREIKKGQVAEED